MLTWERGNRKLWLCVFGLLLCVGSVGRVATADDLTLEVASRARALQPGEAILLTVTPSHPLASLEGAGFDHAAAVWQDSASRSERPWTRLGVDARNHGGPVVEW